MRLSPRASHTVELCGPLGWLALTGGVSVHMRQDSPPPPPKNMKPWGVRMNLSCPACLDQSAPGCPLHLTKRFICGGGGGLNELINALITACDSEGVKQTQKRLLGRGGGDEEELQLFIYLGNIRNV